MNTVLITGGNKGIGLEFCRQFLERGYRVIATCRNSSRELNSLNTEVLEGIDVCKATDRNKIAEKLKGSQIDILINNAGLLVGDHYGEIGEQELKKQFDVNAVAPVLLSQSLRNLMPEGAKIIFITSRMGSIEDNTSGAYYGYRMSKAALNIAARSLSIDLKPKKITVGLLHPGYVRTDMTGNQGTLSPMESVRDLITRIDGLNGDLSGTFQHSNGQSLPW